VRGAGETTALYKLNEHGPALKVFWIRKSELGARSSAGETNACTESNQPMRHTRLDQLGRNEVLGRWNKTTSRRELAMALCPQFLSVRMDVDELLSPAAGR
jgi:hypothetical protein